jgi:hypothetical protein
MFYNAMSKGGLTRPHPLSPEILTMVLRSALTSMLAVTVLLGIPGCAATPRQRNVEGGAVDTGPGSLAAARKYLEGRWSLQSFDVYPPGKGPLTLKGAGTLTYDAFGNLTMEIRADQAASDLLAAAGIDIRDGIISSSGRTAVDMPNRTLTYVIEGQPTGDTGPLALRRPRHWQVDGNVLTLTTKDDAGNAVSIGRWQKVP